MKPSKQITAALPLSAAFLMALAPSAMQAAPEGQLGILTPATLAGDNPATGAPWADGDTYRFAFITSTNPGATLTTIEEYNALIQGLADGSSLNLGDASWKIIGSTADVDARDNTSTNPDEDGTGEAIFLLDGSTVVANDYADLWDGEIQHIIDMNENGVVRDFLWPFTGTYKDGTMIAGQEPNSGGPLGSTGEVSQGQGDATGVWVFRQWTSDPRATALPLYGLSDPLEIQGDPFKLTITAAESPDAGYVLTWDSQDGMLYNVLSTSDLTEALADWDLVEGNIEASGTGSNSKNVNPTGTEIFYLVEEFPVPPVTEFEEYFDSTTGPGLPPGWSSDRNDPPDDGTVSTTNWELGTPSNVGPVPPDTPLPSGSQCVATGIASDYYQGSGVETGVETTDIWLRTPEIDLGAATAATLSFRQWTEIEVDGDLDHGSIRILGGSNAPLEVLEDQTIKGDTTGWEEYSSDLPETIFNAGGDTIIKIEFRFEADDYPSPETFAGWYIDNVKVTTPAP